MDGLRDHGGVDVEPLVAAIRAVRSRVPRTATIQEVVLRALESVVKHEATLDGRLVDALVSVGRGYGVMLAMHPTLLVAAALGGQANPDRSDPRKSAMLDSLLAALIEDPAPYQETLYSAAVLARGMGLDATADAAVKLLEQVGRMEASAQGPAMETALRPSGPIEDDNFSWVVKAVLTLTTITLIAASAVKISGAVGEFIAALDDLLGGD